MGLYRTSATSSFFCGGSVIIDAVARSNTQTDYHVLSNEASRQSDKHVDGGVSTFSTKGDVHYYNDSHKNSSEVVHHQIDGQDISVKFKHQSCPDNCKTNLEVSQKLDQDFRFWSVMPHPTTANPELETINVMELLKKEAKKRNDKNLKDACNYLEDSVAAKAKNNLTFLYLTLIVIWYCNNRFSHIAFLICLIIRITDYQIGRYFSKSIKKRIEKLFYLSLAIFAITTLYYLFTTLYWTLNSSFYNVFLFTIYLGLFIFLRFILPFKYSFFITCYLYYLPKVAVKKFLSGIKGFLIKKYN